MKPILSLVIGLLLLTACTSLESASRTSTYRITYRITGSTQSVNLTYNNKTGDTEQVDTAFVPWDMEFEARSGQFLYVSAQNNRESGSVICQILVNGVEAKRAESRGAYVIATCSGRL